MKKILLALSIITSTLFIFAQNKATDPVFSKELNAKLQSACPESAKVPAKPRKILVFTKTSGYRHNDGIVGASTIIENMGKKLGTWQTVISGDVKDIAPEKLKEYDAIVLNNTTGMTFGESDKALKEMSASDRAAVEKRSNDYVDALIKYVANGGGIFAIHGGVDCYIHNPHIRKDFTSMLGGNFINHPWYISNAKVTIKIDDANSPITKGIWQTESFKVKDEIYQMGDSFDRDSCRVLMRLDVDKSPITNEDARDRHTVRKDKDVPLVWIKDYKKGRIAYSGFGHDYGNYDNPKIQELYLRLIQFVCGDLKAETSSIEMGKSVFCPMYEKPTIESIKKLENTKYGQDDEAINNLIFAVASNNLDRKYCAELEKFIYDELSSKNASEVYRYTLAELLWPIKISSKESFKKFSILASEEKMLSVKGRLENALNHYTNQEMPKTVEKQKPFASTLPQDWKEQAKSIRYLADNTTLPLPSWVSFENVSPIVKPILVHALLARNESFGKIRKQPIDSQSMAIAYACYAAQANDKSAIKKIVDSAELISISQRPIVASYIVSIEGDIKDNLLEMLKNANNDQAALIFECFARMNIDEFSKEILDEYEDANDKLKISYLTILQNSLNNKNFVKILGIFADSDGDVKKAAYKTLMKISQSGLDDLEKKAVESSIANAQDKEKSMLGRLISESEKAVKKDKKN